MDDGGIPGAAIQHQINNVHAQSTLLGHARRGLGSMLLAHCESQAERRGYREVELMATLPGVRLYAARGYAGSEQVRFEVGDGAAIEFVPMRKSLHRP